MITFTGAEITAPGCAGAGGDATSPACCAVSLEAGTVEGCGGCPAVLVSPGTKIPCVGAFFGGKRAKSSCTRGAALLRDRFHLARAAGGQSGLLFPTDYCSRKQNRTKRGLFESCALKAAAEAAPLDGLVLLAQQSCPLLHVHFWISNSLGLEVQTTASALAPSPPAGKGLWGRTGGLRAPRAVLVVGATFSLCPSAP